MINNKTNNKTKKRIKRNKRYYIVIAISVLIIVITLVFNIIHIKNHKKQKKIFELAQKEQARIFEKEKQRKIEEIEAKLQKEKQERELYSLIKSTEQKEVAGSKYNRNAFKTIDDLYYSDKKHVYLTFDDGPTSMTLKVLDVLKKENVKATFFVLGSKIKGNEKIIRRAYNEGHTIGNHSFTHNYRKLYTKPGEVLKEYNQTEKELKRVLGQDFNSNLFRFPGGSVGGQFESGKKQARRAVINANLAYIDWNCLTDDSDGETTHKGQMRVYRNTSKNKKGLVILQHDVPNNKNLPGVLSEIIKDLKKEKYVFKNFNDILVKKI